MKKQTRGAPWRIYQPRLSSDVFEVFWASEEPDSYIYAAATNRRTNARLIAVAPELLASLKLTLSMAIGHAADARGVSPAECKDFPWAVEAQAVIDSATEGE